MSKGLEALERLAHENACCRCQYLGKESCSLHYQSNECPCAWLEIEKELKALEIIKEKKVNAWILAISNDVDVYNASIPNDMVKQLTKEEYDLLKEELK